MEWLVMVLVTRMESKERPEPSKGGGLLLRRTAAETQSIKLLIHSLSQYKKGEEEDWIWMDCYGAIYNWYPWWWPSFLCTQHPHRNLRQSRLCTGTPPAACSCFQRNPSAGNFACPCICIPTCSPVTAVRNHQQNCSKKGEKRERK